MGRIKSEFRLKKGPNSPNYFYQLPTMKGWKSTGTSNKTEATKMVRAIIKESEMQSTTNTDSSTYTVKRYSRDWFVLDKDERIQRLEEENKNLTERYCNSVRGYFENYVFQTSFGNLVMNKVTKDDVYKLRSDLMKKTTPSMTNHIMNAVKQLFRYAMLSGDIPTNPTALVGQIHEDKKPIIVYTKEELQKMFSIEDPEKMIQIWGSYADFVFEFLALNSGMRNAELRCLKWKNVDLKKGLLFIDDSFKDSQSSIVGKPKNGTQRFLVMGNHLIKVLSTYKKQYAKFKENEDFVFSNRYRKNWGYTHTIKHHKEGLKRAGVEYRKQHTYRHTFNTVLKETKEVSDKDIRFVSGWADEKIQNNYSHMELSSAYNVADALNFFWDNCDIG